MSVWKLVSGILSIIFSLIVLFQSCAVGINNTIQSNGEVSGSAGVIVAIILLSAGIISIATRHERKHGSTIALIILFGIGSLLGFTLAGSYTDLTIWAFWCLICIIIAIVALTKGDTKKT